MWKVTAIENQNKLRFMCDTTDDVGELIYILFTSHVPKPWRGQLYQLRFEVEFVPDGEEIDIDFDALEELVSDDDTFVDELELEDIEEEL